MATRFIERITVNSANSGAAGESETSFTNVIVPIPSGFALKLSRVGVSISISEGIMSIGSIGRKIYVAVLSQSKSTGFILDEAYIEAASDIIAFQQVSQYEFGAGAAGIPLPKNVLPPFVELRPETGVAIATELCVAVGVSDTAALGLTSGSMDLMFDLVFDVALLTAKEKALLSCGC